MDVTPNQWIDLALNAAGYLVAGAIWLVMYSMITSRRAKRRQAPVPAAPSPVTPQPKPAPRAGSTVYVPLAGGGATARTERPGSTAQPVTDGRRNRTEVLRLAREMLRQGAPRNQVQSRLPISEGELALLNID